MLDTIVNSLIEFSRDGGISYSLAAFSADLLGLTAAFDAEYGLAGEWVDPQTSEPIAIDMGEFIPWLEEKGA